MEQLSMEITTSTQEETAPAAEVEEAATTAENTEAANTEKAKPQQQQHPETATTEQEQQVKNNSNINLLYEECLSFIPGSCSGKQDPKYVYTKLKKDHEEFDFTHEHFLEILEEANLLKYLQVLQISKPNKSVDVYFHTEDATNFFINKHIEIRGKPIPFTHKA